MTYERKQTSSNSNNRNYMRQNCVLSRALEKISSRWSVQILFCISFELNRFSLIKKTLPQISDQVLGQRLKQLLEDNLICKKKYDEKTYLLTEQGQTLIPILKQLTDWGS